MISNLIKM